MTANSVLQDSPFDSPSKIKKIQCFGCDGKISLDGLVPFNRQKCPSCETEFEIPLQINQYLLETCLSDNGVIAEYRATDMSLNRDVLIKKLDKSFYHVGKTPVFPFLQVNAAVNIFSTIVSDDELYLVTELIDGHSIKSYIKSKGKLDQKKVVTLALIVADILAETAESGVDHGNLLTESILVDANGEIRISDFMLYQNILLDHNSPESTSRILDVRYNSNSRLLTLDVSQRSDLFSFGVCLYEMLCGELPNTSTEVDDVIAERNQAEFHDSVLSDLGLDPALISLVMALLKEDPQISTFNEVKTYLEDTFVKKSKSSTKKSASKSDSINKPTKKAPTKKAPTKKAPTKTSTINQMGKTKVKLPVKNQKNLPGSRGRGMNSKSKLKKLFR